MVRLYLFIFNGSIDSFKNEKSNKTEMQKEYMIIGIWKAMGKYRKKEKRRGKKNNGDVKNCEKTGICMSIVVWYEAQNHKNQKPCSSIPA